MNLLIHICNEKKANVSFLELFIEVVLICFSTPDWYILLNGNRTCILPHASQFVNTIMLQFKTDY